MEERGAYKNSRLERYGRKSRVAGENLIAVIPPVRVIERIRFEVPAVVVPVTVDRPQNALCAYTAPSITPVKATIHRMLSGLNLMWDLKVHQRGVPILFFFE